MGISMMTTMAMNGASDSWQPYCVAEPDWLSARLIGAFRTS